MAEEALTQDEQVIDALLADLDEDEDPVVSAAEAQAEERDEKQSKQHKVKEAEKFVTKDEYQIEKLDAQFEKEASDEEREYLGILRTGQESPAQLKKLQQFVKTRIGELHKTEEPPDDAVEQAAEEMAAERYGAGPVKSDRKQGKTREDMLTEELVTNGPNADRALAELLAGNDKFLASRGVRFQ